MHTQSNKTRIKCASCDSLYLFSSVDLKTHNPLQLVRFGCSVWHCVLQWKNALTVLLPHTIMCKSLVHRQSATTTSTSTSNSTAIANDNIHSTNRTFGRSISMYINRSVFLSLCHSHSISLCLSHRTRRERELKPHTTSE